MLISYYKGEPNTYFLSHRNGEIKRHGAGIEHRPVNDRPGRLRLRPKRRRRITPR